MSIKVFAAAVGVLIFATTLAVSIRRLVRTLQDSFEATVELKPEMPIALATPSPKLIYFKGPRLSHTYGLWLALRDAAGNPIGLKRILVPLSWSGALQRRQLPCARRHSLHRRLEHFFCKSEGVAAL